MEKKNRWLIILIGGGDMLLVGPNVTLQLPLQSEDDS